MIRKIPVTELRPGMFVVDTGLSWMDYPYLFADEGIIESSEQVLRIAEDYTEAFIDTERGTYATLDIGDGGMAEAVTSEAGASPARVPLAMEIAHARKFYDESLTFARSFMNAVGEGGGIDYERSETFVEGVIDSVSRNPDALVSMTKLRAFDEYTYTHCINVAVLSTAFAEFRGLSRADLMDVGLAGLYHDIGKTLIPPRVLNKPGRLTESEFNIIRKHPERGLLMLRSGRPLPERVLRGVAEHHEKYNGSGYPARRRDEAIHPFARIISLADVYDALTSRRVYKNGLSPHNALRIMYGMRGQDFHPGSVERFIKFIGIYPVGALVRLDNGMHAVVCGSNSASPLLPEVIVAFDRDMRPVERMRVDMAAQAAGAVPVAIEACLEPADYGIRTEEYLG
ncbi:putative nucleotidyltransferase with HDIG domain [Desulfobaculum xiamenense]|uniref:Putative nucleotidyltransferase with HDIG domain n=1 Tax=Desulfobaculum xiamenense TaxID=995050 RepID=A0A846QJH5_9BACT|nr:HD-GYP domain-containing protein [Desulfobaculum xiamenense]NJB68378.1 putative nucleotidyltransferase with HDIG domain [Desulfobaculum xiamenense]